MNTEKFVKLALLIICSIILAIMIAQAMFLFFHEDYLRSLGYECTLNEYNYADELICTNFTHNSFKITNFNKSINFNKVCGENSTLRNPSILSIEKKCKRWER